MFCCGRVGQFTEIPVAEDGDRFLLICGPQEILQSDIDDL